MLVFCVFTVLNTIFPCFDCVPMLGQNFHDTKAVMMDCVILASHIGGSGYHPLRLFHRVAEYGTLVVKELHIRGKCIADHRPGHLHRLFGFRFRSLGGVRWVGFRMVLNALSLSCPTKSDAKPVLVPLSDGLMFDLGDSGLIFQSFEQQKPPNRRLLCSVRSHPSFS